MEQSNFLQRPGGLGPMPGLKPLGMPMSNPGAYINDDVNIAARRQAYSDNVNRVFAQYNIDHGTYVRQPVDPNPYAEGNITESTQTTGPAGYNHKNMPLPNRPMDMPKEQYITEMINEADPMIRATAKALTLMPQQDFLNRQDVAAMSLNQDYRRSDDLMMQEVTDVKK
tara:strand:- start:169 stop:675 length:507 start_codon:yes stop_codon:yes gene_type:complete